MFKAFNKLTRKEQRHFTKEAGCRSLAAFKRTRETQLLWESVRNKDGPGDCRVACWECRQIARKLGLEEKP